MSNYGRHRPIRDSAIQLWWVGHSLPRARLRLGFSRQQAEHACIRAILATLSHGPLPDSGDRSGHKLARGRYSVWVLSPCPLGGWQVHTVFRKGRMSLKRGTGKWWVVRLRRSPPPARAG